MKIPVSGGGGGATGGGGGGDGGASFIIPRGPPVTISGGGGFFEPEYVEDATPTLSGNTDTMTDMCGRSESTRNGHSNWNIEVKGICSEDQLGDFYAVAEVTDPDTVTVASDVLGSRSGEYIVEDAQISWVDDLNSIAVPASSEPKQAYEFRITCRSPASE